MRATIRSVDVGVGDGGQGVEEGGGGQVSGSFRAEARYQPGLGQSGHRRLGHHQDGAGVGTHRITFKKSQVATALPRSDPDTFDRPAVRGR